MRSKKNTKRIYYNRNDLKPKWKLIFSALFVVFLFVSVVYKALELQVLNRDKTYNAAKMQHKSSFTLLPERGNIYDRNKKGLATSIDSYSVYIRSKEILKPKEFAKKLSSSTNLSYEKSLSYAVSTKQFHWLERLATPQYVEKIKSINLEGIGFIEEPKRIYPNGHLLGQVIGFTNIDSKGIEGVEYYFDGILAGKPSKVSFKKDARGKKILHTPVNIEQSTSGFDLYLTVDSQLQHIVEKELEKGIVNADATNGMAIMMDPETGEILAMTSYPFFNPNDYTSYPEKTMRNLPVWYSFEPGSTLKIFLVAAALEEKLVNPGTKYNCENGSRKVGPKTIRDTKPHGVLTVTETLEVSSNICASKIGETIGKKELHDYLKDFGFGNKIGVDLPGEPRGKLLSPTKWGPVELATISFGQGISVTSLQLATALSSIANGGYLMKPYIVKKIVSPDGKLIRENTPHVIRRVISYDTSKQITRMLEGVVNDGTGKKAQIPGFRVAGKTGTAQIPDFKSGGYQKDKYLASFIGFAPIDRPEIVLVVILEDPKDSYYGGSVAAPIFKSITEKVLFNIGITPNQQFTQKTIMPNLKGKSARDVMRWAEQKCFDIELTGSGYVTKQSPAAGEILKRATNCTFVLKQDL